MVVAQLIGPYWTLACTLDFEPLKYRTVTHLNAPQDALIVFGGVLAHLFPINPRISRCTDGKADICVVSDHVFLQKVHLYMNEQCND
jgi:hypothetical protein